MKKAMHATRPEDNPAPVERRDQFTPNDRPAPAPQPLQR
jgi:hypothetical protein